MLEGDYSYTFQMACNGKKFGPAVTKTVHVTFTAADLINWTKSCVETAENEPTQSNVNVAQYFVNKLPAGATKTGLQNRVNAVQAIIDLPGQIAAAKAAVQAAFAHYAQADYSTANWTALQNAEAAGITNIGKAATKAAADTAKASAIAAMAAVKTKAGTVIDEINSLPAAGSLKLASKAAVQKARTDYNALTAAQKALVTNLALLTAAEGKIADLTAAQPVIDEIKSLPASGSLKLDNKSAVQKARADYTALTFAQKALVTNLDALTAAEDGIAALEADQAAAQTVIDEINRLPVPGFLTLEDLPAVQYARDDYDILTDAQQALVTNLSTLEDAEDRIAALETDQAAAQTVVDEINRLPASSFLTLDDQPAVQGVRDDYNALTGDQQLLVADYYGILTAAEDRIADLASAQTVIDEITKLPDADALTLEDSAAVQDARDDYDALTGDQQLLVWSCYDTLTAAEGRIADLEAAQTVIDEIMNLPEADALMLSDKNAVDTVATDFNSLTQDRQALVTNAGKLADDVQKIKDLIAAALDAEKSAAHDDLNQELSKYSPYEANYGTTVWQSMIRAKTDGDNNIDNVTSIPDVDAARDTATEKMQGIAQNAANDAVLLAVGSALQADVDVARALVDVLPDGEAKDSFESKLDAVQAIIDATAAVVKAECSYKQADEDAAHMLADALPASTAKTGLENRLGIVQKTIDRLAATAISTMIKNLPSYGSLTLADKETVEAAWDAYNALSPAQQVLVNNYQDLLFAVQEMTTIENAQAVIDMISALPPFGSLTIADADAVNAAGAAFDALSDNEKYHIPNTLWSALSDDRLKMGNLEAAQAVIDEIAALPQNITMDTFTWHIQIAVSAARAHYNSLGSEQKDYVTNYAVLVDDTDTVIALNQQAEDVETMIVALPDPSAITQADKAAVDAAKAAYDQLAHDLLSYVGHYQKLLDDLSALGE